MTRYDRWSDYVRFILLCNLLRWLRLICIVRWDNCTWAPLCTVFVAVITVSISMTVWWVRERLMSGWETCIGNGGDDNDLEGRGGGEFVPCTGVGLCIDRWGCNGGTGVTVALILFHRYRNVFWWMSAYTIQPGHASGAIFVSFGRAHARKIVVDCVVEVVWCRSDRSRLQCSLMRSIPDASMERERHG